MSARTCQPGGNTPAADQEVTGASPERLGRLQQISCTAIRDAAHEGMTAHEVSLATRLDRHSIQPRISELRRMGLVIASGKRQLNPSGKTATVWIASEYADGVPQSAAAT